MERERFKRIERIMYNYRVNKLALAQLRREIIDGSCRLETCVQSGRTSSMTESKGMKLADRKLQRVEREIVAVELALEHLPREYQELFHLRYEREQIWEVIFPMINCHRATCFRMRDRLVDRVDAKLNFLNSRLSLGA